MNKASVFYAKREGWNGTAGLKRLGVTLVCLGLLAVFVIPGLASLLGLGVVNLVSVRWLESNPIIKLNSDHLEMKVAILAPRKLALYSDLQSLIEKSQDHVLLETKQGKKLRLPVTALTDTARDQLLSELRGRVAA